LNGAGAWTGAGAGVEKNNPLPGPLTGAERGIEVGAAGFGAQEAP